MYNKTNQKQMGQNRSQYLWENCKNSSEWNEIILFCLLLVYLLLNKQ